MSDYDYGLTRFLFAFAFGLLCISFIHLIFLDVGMSLFLIALIFIVSSIIGILSSNTDHIIRSWRVVITTVDDGVYYLGRNLSWADAKKLRDDAVAMFESKDLMVSVKCTNTDGRYGVRSFVKSNIVHIGWLED